ncbi:hypothetical protein EN784_01195 [bacterium M00.F.Ca.ET.141.01.1.1]|nr:hypothetical protein EN784_01195 [bacterium M00.F.Ca.ET.141.01.1.1]
MLRSATTLIFLAIASPSLAANPEELVTRAIAEFDAAKTQTSTALASTVAAWSDLQNVVIEFPDSDIAARVLSADPSLRIDRRILEKDLVEGLVARVFELKTASNGINGLDDLPAEDAQALLASLVRNRQFDLAVQAVTIGQDSPTRQIWLAHYLALSADQGRAETAAGASAEARDAAARGLLASKGAKAAMELVDRTHYNAIDGGDTLKLETLLLIGQTKNAVDDNAQAARDAFDRARDLASSMGRNSRAALALARAGLAKEAIGGAGFTKESWDNDQSACLDTLISVFAARGEDDVARKLIGSIDWVPVLPLLVRLAAAERIRGADADALATLATAPQTIVPAELAAAYADVGFIEKATEIIGSTKNSDAWAKILGAIAVRDGVARALKVASEHGIEVDEEATRSIALGGSVGTPEAAISMAKDDPQLAIDIGIILTSRSNFEGANSAFAMAKTHELTSEQANQIRTTQFEIALALGNFEMAQVNLPYFSQSDTQVSLLIDAELRAGHLNDAVKVVAGLADNYDARTLVPKWCWQIAMSMVKTASPAEIANFIFTNTQIDLKADEVHWARLLVAAGQWSEALKIIEELDSNNYQSSKAALYIAILNRI